MNTALVAALLFQMTGRQDANETAIFARQLEYIETETYKIEYPELRSREYVPVDRSVPSGALTFTYRVYDWVGMAKIIANFADDLPRVDLLGKEVTQKIESLGVSYGYSIQEIESANMAGINVPSEKAEAARQAVENKIDQLTAIGDAQTNLPGFVNSANVPVLTTTELVGDWIATATPAEVLADLHIIANRVTIQTKNTRSANTLLLPMAEYNKIATTVVNALTGETILSAFLRTTPYIKSVDQWLYLATADSAGTGPRAIAYHRDPRVVRVIIAREFTQQPPQPKNLEFNVPCHARFGGVSWRYPLGGVYADDI